MKKNITIPAASDSWQRTLFILFFAQLMVAVGFSSIFPFLPLYVEQLGSTSGLGVEILSGLVYSAQSFTMMLASPFWGALADRYGRKLMVGRSMFGGAVILLMMAFVSSAEQLVALRAVQGLLTGTVAAANALLASVTPRRHTGYAMGMLQVGFGTGLAFGPLIGGAVADFYGYHTVFYLTAVMLSLAGVMVVFGVQEKFDPIQGKEQRKSNLISEWGSVIAIPGVWVTFLMRFSTSLGRMMIMPIIPLFIQSLLIDLSRLNTLTGLVMGIASGATTISAVFLGRLGDRIGYRKVLVACTGVLGAIYALQGFVTTWWQLLILQALVGVAMGGVIPLISALLANYVKAGGEGSVFGMDNSINAAGRAIAPMLGAAVASAWSYQAAFLSTGVIFLLASLFAAWRLPPSRTTVAVSRIVKNEEPEEER
jgi:DHA1 family multidrug resistance protein-like MFS transporter